MQFLILASLRIKCSVKLRGNLNLVYCEGKVLITQYKNSCNINWKFVIIVINVTYIF